MATASVAAPAVAVIVCTIARPHAVACCVRSILANSYAPLSVLVVDQRADDAIAEVLAPLAATDERLRHLRAPVPGKTRAQNLAIAQSTADLFLFTDDDCMVPTDWVARVVATFRRLPDAGVLFGEVYPPAGHDWALEYSPSMVIPREVQLRPTFLPRVNYLYGCSMAVRRQTFSRIGLFDEQLGPGGVLAEANEEVDFHLRALLARPPVGVYLTPAFHVVHEHGSRPQGEPTRRLLRAYEMGKSAMLTKHALRGEIGAGCQLALRAFAPLLHGFMSVIRTGRPRGIGMIVPYAHGFIRALRVARHSTEPPLAE